jgi:hypothetical protein
MLERAKIAASLILPLVQDRETAVALTAIAGAESQWWPDALGDSPAMLEALGFPSTAAVARTFNCPLGSEEGPASVGLWQIFMPVWRPALRDQLQAPGVDPCELRNWLMDPHNNARAAAMVLREHRSLDAWTTYSRNLHLPYMPMAEQAVDFALRRRRNIFPIAIISTGIIIGTMLVLEMAE